MWHLLRPLLFLLPAEVAHNLAITCLAWLQHRPWALAVVRKMFPTPALAPVQAMGLTFPSRVGLAAGLDKNAVAYRGLLALGFGFVEIGSVTAVAQPGNPEPRLFRLPKDRALLNRMGFNNDGAAAIAPRLTGARDGILGVNIGKSKIAAEQEAAQDYAASTRLLAKHADYIVVNVSSPNTPGLRDLQNIEKLRPILRAVQAAQREVQAADVPLLVKVAPDLNDGDLDAVVDLAIELGLAGMVLTNTTVSRDGLATPNVAHLGAGGVSGAPLKARSLAVLKRVAERAQGKLCLIAAGGIETQADVDARLAAGATLIQVYSAFVYLGPALMRRLA